LDAETSFDLEIAHVLFMDVARRFAFREAGRVTRAQDKNSGLRGGRSRPILSAMKLPLAVLFLVLDNIVAVASPAEDQVREAIKSPDLTVVHLWAPWCSNCLAELKSGGWSKIVKENPKTKFVFVSVWNDGNDGRAMLDKFGLTKFPNVVVLADPGPRRGDEKIKQFAGLPLSWIPTTWIYKGGDLCYALNYGEIRFPVLQQFFDDSENEWSHKDGNTD
jgi:thiol-disulfide isomerase/thioredoxin